MIVRLGLNAAAHLAAGAAMGAMTVVTMAYLAGKGREAQREMRERKAADPTPAGPPLTPNPT